MSEMSFSSLEESIVKEIGMIGAAHAATALARLTGRRIDVKPTQMYLLPLKEVYVVFAQRQDLETGIYVRTSEGMNGGVLFFMPKEQSYPLIDLVIGKELGSTKMLGEMEQSAFKEIGNILCAAYVNSISDMTKATIRMSAPKMVFDRRGQIVQAILNRLFPDETMAILIENTFAEKDFIVSGFFLFVPRGDEMRKIVHALEESVE